MANIRLIRQRIQDIQNIAKVTQAMEMVATAKVGRVRNAALATRPYSNNLRTVVTSLTSSPQEDEKLPPLLQRRQARKIAVVHIAPDRGLCGGLDANVNHMTAKFLSEQTLPVMLVVIGRKGLNFMRHSQYEIAAEFARLRDRPSLLNTGPISRIIIDDYTKGAVDLVYLAYARFVSATVQQPVLEQILPLERPATDEERATEYIYEPNAKAVLRELLPRFVEIQVYQAVLEAIASEQAARMVSMRNATNNTKDLLTELTLKFNKARQEAITSGILDISRGAGVVRK